MSYCLLEGDAAQLCCAVRTGDVTDVQTLVEAGVDVNSAHQNGETALHVAAFTEQGDIIQKLLKAGAYTDIKNQNGQTPLHIAASQGYAEIVLLLLEANADTDIKTYSTEMTALHMASLNGHTQVVKQLLNIGADVDLLDVINKPAEFYAANQEIIDLFCTYHSDLEKTEHMLQGQTKKGESSTPVRKVLNHKMKFSQHHEKIMKLNVFDRLTRKKTQIET